MSLDDYAVQGLTDEERDRFTAAIEEARADPINMLPLLNLTPLHPLDVDPPEPGKISVS